MTEKSPAFNTKYAVLLVLLLIVGVFIFDSGGINIDLGIGDKSILVSERGTGYVIVKNIGSVTIDVDEIKVHNGEQLADCKWSVNKIQPDEKTRCNLDSQCNNNIMVMSPTNSDNILCSISSGTTIKLNLGLESLLQIHGSEYTIVLDTIYSQQTVKISVNENGDDIDTGHSKTITGLTVLVDSISQEKNQAIVTLS